MDSYFEKILNQIILVLDNDEIFKINWPFKPKIISNKDKNYPKFNLNNI